MLLCLLLQRIRLLRRRARNAPPARRNGPFAVRGSHMGEFDRFRLDCDGQKSRTLRRFVEPTQQYPLPESCLTSSYTNKILLSMTFLRENPFDPTFKGYSSARAQL